MKSILGMGNALVDILAVPGNDKLLKKYSLPKGSMQHVDEQKAGEVYEDIMKYGASIITGGSAANTVAGISQLGLKTGFLGKVGNDELGDLYNSDLEQLNVKSLLLRSEKGTGRAMVVITPDSERTFAVYLGAAMDMKAKDINPSIFDDYDYFHIEGYTVQDRDLMETAMRTAHDKGKIVSLDLASYNVVDENMAFLYSIINNYTDIVFANRAEAKSLTGKNPEKAIEVLSDLCDIAVVKIGAKGSLIRQGSTTLKAPAVDIGKPVDLTGAGDLYASGFLYGLLSGKDLETCAKMGTVCASKIIQVIGTKLPLDVWESLRTEVNRM
ncbi:MAG: adenosine kinase [Prevotellaceae bacterium]|jgi:sugar/nucleoside kinase (ribokinase family)|nr:adenosine kinase [Prevotellaceae bacterium]